MKYLTVAVLYAVFSAAACFAGVLGMLGALGGRFGYTSNICKALDRLLAAMLGWDGSATVSKECGRTDCRFCRVLCRVLDVLLERGHCAREAGS